MCCGNDDRVSIFDTWLFSYQGAFRVNCYQWLTSGFAILAMDGIYSDERSRNGSL